MTSNLICAEAYAKGKLQTSLNGVNSARGVVETVSKIVFGIKEMELGKEKIDMPLNIKVTVTGKDSSPLELPEPKKETVSYTRNRGRPKNTPDPVEIFEDDIDYDMESEIEYIEMGGDIDWERESDKRSQKKRLAIQKEAVKRRFQQWAE